MEWQLVLALVLGIPVILFPAAYVWHLNIGGALSPVREKGRAAGEALAGGYVPAGQAARSR
jgi:hypothetical protein